MKNKIDKNSKEFTDAVVNQEFASPLYVSLSAYMGMIKEALDYIDDVRNGVIEDPDLYHMNKYEGVLTDIAEMHDRVYNDSTKNTDN